MYPARSHPASQDQVAGKKWLRGLGLDFDIVDELFGIIAEFIDNQLSNLAIDILIQDVLLRALDELHSGPFPREPEES